MPKKPTSKRNRDRVRTKASATKRGRSRSSASATESHDDLAAIDGDAARASAGASSASTNKTKRASGKRAATAPTSKRASTVRGAAPTKRKAKAKSKPGASSAATLATKSKTAKKKKKVTKTARAKGAQELPAGAAAEILDAIADLEDTLQSRVAEEANAISDALVTRPVLTRVLDDRLIDLTREFNETSREIQDVAALFSQLSKIEIDLAGTLQRIDELPDLATKSIAEGVEQSLGELRDLVRHTRELARGSELERVHERVVTIDDTLRDIRTQHSGTFAGIEGLTTALGELRDGLATATDRLDRVARLPEQIDALSDRIKANEAAATERLDRVLAALEQAKTDNHQSKETPLARHMQALEKLFVRRMDEQGERLEALGRAVEQSSSRPHSDNADKKRSGAPPPKSAPKKPSPRKRERESRPPEPSDPSAVAERAPPARGHSPEDYLLDGDLDDADITASSSALTAFRDDANREITGRHRTVWSAARGLSHLPWIALRELYDESHNRLADLTEAELCDIVRTFVIREDATATALDDGDDADNEDAITLDIGGAKVRAIRLLRERL